MSYLDLMFGEGELVLEQLAAHGTGAGHVRPQVLPQDVRPAEGLLARRTLVAAVAPVAAPRRRGRRRGRRRRCKLNEFHG